MESPGDCVSGACTWCPDSASPMGLGNEICKPEKAIGGLPVHLSHPWLWWSLAQGAGIPFQISFTPCLQ